MFLEFKNLEENFTKIAKKNFFIYGNNEFLIKETCNIIYKNLFIDNSFHFFDENNLDLKKLFLESISNSIFQKTIVFNIYDSFLKNFKDEDIKLLNQIFKVKSKNIFIVFIFKSDKIENNKNLLKIFSENTEIICCNTPSRDDLFLIIKKLFEKKNINISKENFNLIFEKNNDIESIYKIIDNFYINDQNEIKDENIKILNDEKKYNIFEIEDFILNSPAFFIKALENYLNKSKNNDIINLVNFFYNLFLRLLILKNKKNIKEEDLKNLKINNFFLEKYIKLSSFFSKEELIRLLQKLNQIDLKIKGIKSSYNIRETLKIFFAKLIIQIRD
jgi:DNA polymerase III delta subunit